MLCFYENRGGVKTRLKKAMGLGIASVFIVGGSIVSAMAIVMLIPSFAFADDGPFIKDLSKLRAKPYEWRFYDENGKAIDKRVILADVKMKAISARHIETHGVKIQPDGKEFVKDYFNNSKDVFREKANRC